MIEQKEKYKIMVMAILLGICCFLTYHFHVILTRGTFFTHFFYIPIILAAFWWRRKGLVLAIFLVALLILSHYTFPREYVDPANDYLRAFMFMAIAFIVATLSERIAREQKKTAHLNAVLRAIRKVNQLITKEKGRDSLLQKACNALVDARGYDAAWLGFLSDGETFATVKGSGFRDDVARFCEHVMGGDHTPCIKNALAQKEKLVLVDKSGECEDCFFKSACVGKEAAIIRVEYAGRLFGLLAILLAPDVTADEEEKELLKEVAGDISFALHDMEMEEAQKRAEEKVKEAYRLREHFLKETSHRIITPVAIIGGNTELLLESSNLDEDQKDKIMIIRERNAEVQKQVRDALAGKYLEEEEGGEG